MQTMINDYLVERRALSKKLSFWRIIAVLVAIAGIVGLSMRFSGASGMGAPHIARISIEGVIIGDRAMLKLIKDVQQSNAAGVIVSIESPGGTTTGSEQLYDALRALGKQKPVVAVVGNMAASGGYIAALGADQIVAYGNSLVGSIGVLFQIPNVSKLLTNVGVQVEEVKSSPLKAAPNGFTPTSEAAKQALAALVDDSYGWFKGLVKERRRLDEAQLAIVSDGRVFTGRQGLENKLVDRLGGEDEAVLWLQTERGVAKNLTIRDWKPKKSAESLGILGMAAEAADRLGYSGISRFLHKSDAAAKGALLDGMVTIWQGSLSN